MLAYLIKINKYNTWANDLLIHNLRSQEITDESVLKFLSHIVLSESIWMMRLKGEDYSNKNFWKVLSITECNRLSQENSKKYSDYLKEKSDNDLERLITYKNSKGIEYSNSIEDILTHIYGHSGYHRGQIAKEVRKLDKEPAYTDYIEFIRTTFQK
ncbi:MAG: damage-inducible protein DinB [Bacteroidetes bacterium]|nr:damage-inducible protein DinB [Bacteroidota bacterium]